GAPQLVDRVDGVEEALTVVDSNFVLIGHASSLPSLAAETLLRRFTEQLSPRGSTAGPQWGPPRRFGRSVPRRRACRARERGTSRSTSSCRRRAGFRGASPRRCLR